MRPQPSARARLFTWTLRRCLQIVGQTRGRNLLAAGFELAEALSLEDGVSVRNMSRGMRQKLGLILALVHKPKLLVLDEPTSALDPLMQRWLNRHLRARAADGATVFFSSHTLSEVEELCDRVAIVRAGELVAEESVDTLRQRAGRQVNLRWHEQTQAESIPAPPFLRLDERAGRNWSCMLTGPVSDLIQWAAGKPLDDLIVNPPDLEAVFRNYYEQERDAE